MLTFRSVADTPDISMPALFFPSPDSGVSTVCVFALNFRNSSHDAKSASLLKVNSK